jgi:hypothetical protein
MRGRSHRKADLLLQVVRAAATTLTVGEHSTVPPTWKGKSRELARL